jgi:MFS family permease
LRKKLLLLGVAMLALAYGYYTTLARVSGGEEHATAVAVAEMASAGPAVLFGWLADKKGMRVAASAAPLSAALALVGTSPPVVFLTLSLFYSAFIVALLAANEAGAEELGASVGVLSLGWALGVALMPYLKTPLVASLFFLLGSVAVLLSVPNVSGRGDFLSALPKLKKFIPPLALFMGAEYVAYALTAWRFYNVADKLTFVLAYAVGPGITAFVGGMVAGKALERWGPEKTFLFSVFAYPAVVALALLAPPPLCLVSWSIPIYPFYEAGLVALVTKMVPEAKGASLGLTYSTMAVSSILALPLTVVRGLELVATISIVMMIISGIIMKMVISHILGAQKRASPRPSA